MVVRKINFSLCSLFLVAAPVVAGEFTGWISDSSCGAANASAEAASRDCAERCIKGGAAAVLVTDGDGKVLKLAGKADINAHLRHKVKITGEVKGETLTVKSIAKAD